MKIRHFEKNAEGRDFVIGDIHAHKKRFLKALESVNFDKSCDRLFCVGDLIDRGHQPLYILDCLREDWFYSIIGNHEQMILDRFEFPVTKPLYISSIKTKFDAMDLHEKNGGKWFGKLRMSAQQNIYHALKKLPYAISLETEYGQVGLVHAEVPMRFKHWNDFTESLEKDADTLKSAIWGRDALAEFYDYHRDSYWREEEGVPVEIRYLDGIVVTVHGHTMVDKPVVSENQVWIDTGYKTGELSILEIRDVVKLAKDGTLVAT